MPLKHAHGIYLLAVSVVDGQAVRLFIIGVRAGIHLVILAHLTGAVIPELQLIGAAGCILPVSREIGKRNRCGALGRGRNSTGFGRKSIP